MTDRIEIAAMAAAKAEDASNWHDEHEYYRSGWCNRMAPGIEAADAVMFSDEAVERVRGEIKHHLSPVVGWMALNAKDEDAAREHAAKFNERVELAVRAVIAALKGDA